jgi:hypothetical protein
VHGVTGLESDDAGPAQLVEVDAQLSGGVYQAVILVSSGDDRRLLAGIPDQLRRDKNLQRRPT